MGCKNHEKQHGTEQGTESHSHCCGGGHHGDSHSKKESGSACCHQTDANEKSYQVEGMACEGCAETVTKKALEVAGVEKAHVDFNRKELRISGTFNVGNLSEQLENAGYTISAN
jgi:Cu2+-exporting ATPase